MCATGTWRRHGATNVRGCSGCGRPNTNHPTGPSTGTRRMIGTQRNRGSSEICRLSSTDKQLISASAARSTAASDNSTAARNMPPMMTCPTGVCRLQGAQGVATNANPAPANPTVTSAKTGTARPSGGGTGAARVDARRPLSTSRVIQPANNIVPATPASGVGRSRTSRTASSATTVEASTVRRHASRVRSGCSPGSRAGVGPVTGRILRPPPPRSAAPPRARPRWPDRPGSGIPAGLPPAASPARTSPSG